MKSLQAELPKDQVHYLFIRIINKEWTTIHYISTDNDHTHDYIKKQFSYLNLWWFTASTQKNLWFCILFIHPSALSSFIIPFYHLLLYFRHHYPFNSSLPYCLWSLQRLKQVILKRSFSIFFPSSNSTYLGIIKYCTISLSNKQVCEQWNHWSLVLYRYDSSVGFPNV